MSHAAIASLSLSLKCKAILCSVPLMIRSLKANLARLQSLRILGREATKLN